MERENRNVPLNDADVRLNALFLAYREASPDPEPSVNFTPAMWAKIEAGQASTNLFGRMAKGLVTVALAATVVLGILVSTANVSSTGKDTSGYNGTYLEALTVDHASSLEPLNLERISEMENQ